jgi:hypothetical protein
VGSGNKASDFHGRGNNGQAAVISGDPVNPLLPPLIVGKDGGYSFDEDTFLNGRYKRKTNAIELPTLQKRIRHRE